MHSRNQNQFQSINFPELLLYLFLAAVPGIISCVLLVLWYVAVHMDTEVAQSLDATSFQLYLLWPIPALLHPAVQKSRNQSRLSFDTILYWILNKL